MNGQVKINIEDVREMLGEKDVQILQLRFMVKEINNQLDQKIKELEKCHQNNTESDTPQ